MTEANALRGAAGFRARFRAGEHLLGTFIKSPGIHSVEIIGSVGFDFVVLDGEHAPLDRAAIDLGLCAARAAGVAGFVRVSSAAPTEILTALDCGAVGVLVPHVFSVEKAREAVAASRYRGGARGFSSGGRAGDYGARGLWEHVDAQDRQTTVIAMIEDPQALDQLDAIAAVEGLDGFFIGRADLTLALGAESPGAPQIMEIVRSVAKAGRAAGKCVCVMAASADEARSFQEMGVSAFIVDSDQTFMRRAATIALKAFSALGK